MSDEEIFAYIYIAVFIIYLILFIILVIKDARKTLKDGKR